MLDDIYLEVDRFLKHYKHVFEKHNLAVPLHHFEKVMILIKKDVESKMIQDPISISKHFVFASNSFKAILCYRLTHYLYTYTNNTILDLNNAYKLTAYEISEYVAAQTSIEIHPAALIGKYFVIDHGVNTLIGATSVIGDNCTILNNVLLGARKITNNISEKRHPTLGSFVKIASGVKIFGPVLIGNYVSIGPNCIIKDDIPDHSEVKLMTTLQITRKRKKS